MHDKEVVVLARWPIRYKLSFGVAMLFLIVAILSFSSFRGVYAYRELARSITQRAAEIPAAAQFTRSVAELRFTFKRVRPLQDIPSVADSDPIYVRGQFRANLSDVRKALQHYKAQLDAAPVHDPRIGDSQEERETVRNIERSLDQIDLIHRDEDWVLNQIQLDLLGDEIDRLNSLAAELPMHLQHRMSVFRDDVRGQYRTWIVLTWTTSILSLTFLVALGRLFYRWVFHPLKILVRGSRRVAADDFDHRVQLESHDEMAELAGALNAMTSRFQEIREDLKRQVQQRTKEVVRGEQLASVGFLAAGVAHEINNPLASIAWAAESLESRIEEMFDEEDLRDDDQLAANAHIVQDYLRKIQKEAFRCKGITEKLLDFSRLGDVEKNDTDLRGLIQGVIDMVRHLGQYRRKNLKFTCTEYVSAPVNAPEINQVVLNLITNALDSLEPGGTVEIELHRRRGFAEIIVTDDGCGMNDETLDQLFEPFFTRRRDGQGTGLGLSITYRIVNDHGGTITAHSDGPGRGSRFHVTLPLTCRESHHEEIRQVA